VDVHTVPAARIAQQRPVLNDFARARERALGDIRATLARALREHCDGALDLAYIPHVDRHAVAGQRHQTRRVISAGSDRSYVVRPRRGYCTMTVAPIWTRL
jgi:hypothetical protein